MRDVTEPGQRRETDVCLDRNVVGKDDIKTNIGLLRIEPDFNTAGSLRQLGTDVRVIVRCIRVGANLLNQIHVCDVTAALVL